MSEPGDAGGERIAKRLARAGLCSRREAERWIEAGRVAVDGVVLKTPATIVTEASAIAVDGKPIPEPERPRLFRYHKPEGLVTTNRDPEGRPTVFERLPKDLPRLVSIGRLDIASEGLLLLTNDGELARHLELPTTGWRRRYRVRVYGTVEEPALKSLGRGVTVAGVEYGPIEAQIDARQSEGGRSNTWLVVTLREGKNREVRRVLEHLGLKVSRLIRTAYGPFELGDLARGAVEEVPRKHLREQVGAIYKTLRIKAERHAHRGG